jgi:hypothetical protein
MKTAYLKRENDNGKACLGTFIFEKEEDSLMNLASLELP